MIISMATSHMAMLVICFVAIVMAVRAERKIRGNRVFEDDEEETKK